MKKKIHRQNGMTAAALACGDATIAFFLALHANRKWIARWVSDLITDFCDRENERIINEQLARATNKAEVEPNAHGHIRPHTYRHGKAGRHCKKDLLQIWWYDELPRKDSRVAKECHRPKKGRNAGKRGYRYCA